MRPAIPALLLASCIQAQQLSFHGIVTDAVSHQPMAGVHLILRPADPQKASQGIVFGAISTHEGKFSIEALAQGTYHLDARFNGYLLIPAKMPDGSFDNIIKLKPGEEPRDFSVKLTPDAVVAGHVFDENGDPIPHVPVIAQPASGNGPSQAETDDRGQYRLPVAPGKYYINAMAQDAVGIRNMGGLREIRSDGAAPRLFGNTFYPSALSKDNATPLDLAPGQRADGIDIHLTPLISASISGTVSGLPDRHGNFPRAFVSLSRVLSANEVGFFGPQEKGADVGPDGAFAIDGVAPGRYWITARSNESLRSAPMEIVVQGANLTNLDLALTHGETLDGTVQIEGDKAQSAETEKRTVQLEPDPRRGSPLRADVGADGAFQLKDVFPGKFNVSIAPLPDDAYIKSVKVGAMESPEGTFDLTGGVSGVHIGIVISRDGGQIEGTVLNKDGQPSDLPFPLVALAEADGEPHIQQPEPGTKFSYTGLPPGKYRVIALDPEQLQGNTQEALRALLSKAPEIEVHANDRISRDLKIAYMETSDAK